MNVDGKDERTIPFTLILIIIFSALGTLFMAGGKAPAAGKEDEMTLEEEVEQMTQAEINKLKSASKLSNAKGMEYAPWMNITPEDEAKIKEVVRQKAEVRRKRREESRVSGALLGDSQAQELSGSGLKAKVIDGEVELSWATSAEGNTRGFLIKRRPARTEDFDLIASYKDSASLVSKGPNGGKYLYVDSSVAPGSWVYRIAECENNGIESDICQTLVDVQTKEEQAGAVIAAVGIVVLGLAALAAGILLDPVGGF